MMTTLLSFSLKLVAEEEGEEGELEEEGEEVGGEEGDII